MMKRNANSIEFGKMDIESTFNSLLDNLENAYSKYNDFLKEDNEPDALVELDYIDGMTSSMNILFGMDTVEHKKYDKKSGYDKMKSVEIFDKDNKLIAILEY